MKLIKEGFGRKIYYDEESQTYIKYFPKPKSFFKRLKYILRIRKTPGKNFRHIAEKLQQLDIPTLEVIKAEDYLVVTKAVNALTLNEYQKCHNDKQVRQKYISLIAKLFNAGIVNTDLHGNNLLYDSEKLIVIDLEDFHDSLLKFLPQDKLIYYYLRRHHDQDFCDQVKQRWIFRTPSQQVIDFIYFIRISIKRAFNLPIKTNHHPT